MITDQVYQDYLRQIYQYGDELETRNHRVKSIFDLDPVTFYQTPLVTLRKTAWKMAIREMEWFMSGDPQCPYELLSWWSEQLGDDGRYRRGYSEQFRYSSSDYQSSGFDQIEYIMNGLRSNPNSRRLVMTAWNPYEMAHITETNRNEKCPTCCLPGYVNVICEKRGLVNLDDISIGDKIWDGENFSVVSNKWKTGSKIVFNYKTRYGNLSCTPNHKVVCEIGDTKEIKDCKRINLIKGNDFDRLSVNWNHVKNGLILGDGTSRTNKRNGSIEYILHIGTKDHDYFNTPINDMVTHYHSKYDNSVYHVKSDFKYDYGILPITYERCIPDDVFKLSRSEICDFLLGLFSANGSVNKALGTISLCQTSEKLITQVQLLLNYIGIRSTVRKQVCGVVKWRNGNYKSRDLYYLVVLKKDTSIFVEKIGFIQKYKLDKIRLEKTTMNRNYYTINQVTCEGYKDVYNLTIDSDKHTFWCNGFNVSNCHGSFVQFFVRDNRLHMLHVQRSADMLLGVPHNWIQYWALLLYFARHAKLIVGTMRWVFGDAHCYLHHSHIETIEHLLKCDPLLQLDNSFNLVYNKTYEEQGVPVFKASDFSMEGMIPEPLVLTRPKLL